MENSIKLTTRKEFLMIYHNTQLKQLVALNIDLKMFSGMKGDEVIAEVPIQGMTAQQGSQLMRKITVKQQVEKYTKAKENTLRVIKVTEQLLEDEGVEITPDVIGN